MKAVQVAYACSLVLLSTGIARAQDPVKVSGANYKVVLENAAVRVLRVSVPVGGKTAMHQHPDTMVIALTEAKVRFSSPDGKSQDADLGNETATYMPVHSHAGVNLGKSAVDALLIEFKTKAPGTAAIPTSRPSATIKVLAESPRAVAYRMTADAQFEEPAGSTHDFDQVVIALAPSQVALSIDGKPAKSSWIRGDVQFIGRGVAHASKNAGGKPVDYILVGIK